MTAATATAAHPHQAPSTPLTGAAAATAFPQGYPQKPEVQGWVGIAASAAAARSDPERKRRPSLKVILGCAVLVAGLSYGGLVLWQSKMGAAAAQPEATKSANLQATAAVATVNGKPISTMELAGVMQQGLDRANALDQQVNKAIAADLALKAYPADAEAAVRGAQRDVLAQLYVAKRTQQIAAAVKPEEIKAFYDAQVSDANYRSYKVAGFMTKDKAEAETVAQQLVSQGGAAEKAAAAARFKPITNTNPGAAGAAGGEGYVMPQDIPYALGNVVRQLKPGEYSRPMLVRDGVVMLRVDEVKNNPKPSLEALSSQIKDAIVTQKLAAELSEARKSARIEMH